MKNDCTESSGNARKSKKARAMKPQAKQHPEHTSIEVGRSGDWMPADELREAALAALAEGQGVILDLDGVNYLDASALQILLALDAEEKRQGLHLELANASAELRQWFEFAGAAEQFLPAGASRR